MSLESPQQLRAHQPDRGCLRWSALGPRGAGRATPESATGRGCRPGTCRLTARGPRSAAGTHPRRSPSWARPRTQTAAATRTLQQSHRRCPSYFGANTGNGGSPHSGPRAALVKFSLVCNHQSCIHWGGMGSGEVLCNRIIARPGVTTFFFLRQPGIFALTDSAWRSGSGSKGAKY